MKKGFTLIEMIAAISILSLVALLAIPNVIKSYNKSKINAIVIQENKLVEAGDILLDDYCKDAINDSYKDKCEIYYQKLEEDFANQLSTEKDYKYICVEDIKSLEYYTEELKFGGTPCQGVVVYEIDKQTKLQTDAFSYVECGDEYPIDKTEKEIQLRTLFDKCFDSISSESDHLANKKFTLTIRFVENDVNGKQVQNDKVIKYSDINFGNSILYTFNAKFSRYNNDYVAVASVDDENIVIERTDKKGDGSFDFYIKELPLNKNSVITIVYTVEQYKVATNYYKYALNATNHHNYETFNSKVGTIDNRFRFEKHTIDMPEVIYEEINNIKEKFTREYVYLDGNLKDSSFDGVLDIYSKDYVVDIVYKREMFNINYDNTGGSGCSTHRVKYKGQFGELCTPTRKGYTFKGWSFNKNGILIKSTDVYDYYSDMTLYAVWEANKFKLVFNGNNSSSGSVSDLVCTYDQNCSLPNSGFLRTGYTFTKWYLDSSLTGSGYDAGYNFINYTDKNETIYLYAGWKVNTYYIAFNANGGNGSMDTITLKYTDVINLPSSKFSKNEFMFVGWNGSNGNTYSESQQVSKLTSVNNATFTMSVKWKDIVAPSCTLIANASGVSFGSKTDNYSASSKLTYGINKSSTAEFNSKGTVSLSTGTFYGHVKDEAGNVGYCTIVIGGTYATKYNQTTKTCSSKFAYYTKTTQTCGSTLSGYTKKSKYCNRTPSTYTKTYKTCNRSVSSYSGTCFCYWLDSTNARAIGCTTNSCSSTCLNAGYAQNSGTCTTNYSYSFGGSSTSYGNTSCTNSNISCNASNYGKQHVSCSVASYNYSFGTETSDNVSSCTSNIISCNSSNYQKTYVSCTAKYNYSFGSNTSTSSSCSKTSSFSCGSGTVGQSYVSGCSANYNNSWSDSVKSVTSCSTTSSFSCSGGNNDGKSYVSSCVGTEFACSDSTQTKINNSYCYKY